jgi:Zn-dependent M28 family amino/carboxypeptidase
LRLPSDVDEASRAIDRETLVSTVRFLSDDMLEGRGPATAGDRLARLYIQASMEAMGLEPGAAESGWQQPFDIVGLTPKPPATWEFAGQGDPVTLRFRHEFVAWGGAPVEKATVRDAELVFVGYGIQAPEYDWDDFEGVDLEGKVLVMLNNDPDWDPDLFAGKRRLYYGRWSYKYESAARAGAVGAILIHTRESAGYPWGVVQSSWTGEMFSLPDADGKAQRLEVESWVTEDAARRIVASGGKDLDALVASARSRDFRPVPLGVRTSIEVRSDRSNASTANVLGLLRGRDPELRDQVIVYTAHHDHIGVGEPDEHGDAIYNGALDNAAGIAQMLAVAKAFTQLSEPPRRSVLFLAVGAEEQGLLGSERYAKAPTFPPGRIAANLNMDGGNIWGATEDVALIGRGKSDLDDVAEAAARRQGRRVTDEAFPDRGFFYRSDQFNFARIGVPALYFDTGIEFRGRPPGWGADRVEEWEDLHYHQPSDELRDDWDLTGMIEDAQLMFYAGLAIAEADAMPQWTPGDEFEAARRRALSDLARPSGDR